jgi:ABC-type transporter Mla MlaB component
VNDTEMPWAPLVLEGALTVRTIAGIRASLLDAMSSHDAVQVDCAAAASVDLSFIQLLLAARRSAQQAGKQLTLAAPADGALLAALEQGAFLPPGAADPFWSGQA